MTRSPLQDGAVIVRGSQILAAACLLPLEESADRAVHRYGMRHRAALSISEQTDAIVIVVSEETQAISIASNGRMIGGLDQEALRPVPSSLLRRPVPPAPRHRPGGECSTPRAGIGGAATPRACRCG